MLRAGAVQQMARGSPGADLQQLEPEHVIERERRQRRLFAQHTRPERAFEPIDRGCFAL